MPKIDKADRRDRKRHKAKHGMQIGSRSVFTIQRLQVERKKKRKRKGS